MITGALRHGQDAGTAFVPAAVRGSPDSGRFDGLQQVASRMGVYRDPRIQQFQFDRGVTGHSPVSEGLEMEVRWMKAGIPAPCASFFNELVWPAHIDARVRRDAAQNSCQINRGSSPRDAAPMESVRVPGRRASRRFSVDRLQEDRVSWSFRFPNEK
jgi:hypothetical protein